jgi:hypothetical protein
MAETNADIDGGIRVPEGAGTDRSNGSAALSEKTRNGQGQNTADSCDETQERTQEGGEITEPPKVGDNDLSGYKIDTIFCSTKEFVIYQAGDQVRFALPSNYQVAKGLRRRICDLGGLRASIEDLRAEPSFSALERLRASRELAWALALGFEDDAVPPLGQPKEILTRVDTRLRSLLKSHCRKRYAMSNLKAFAAIEFILILIVLVAPHFTAFAGQLPRYSTFAVFGGLGAFLSVITSIRSVDVNLDLTVWEYVFAGAARILIGVIGAVVVGLALDSSLIDLTFGSNEASAGATSGQLEKHFAMYLVFSFIAGFSESLVPSILRRGEQSAGDEKSSTPDDAIVKEMKP